MCKIQNTGNTFLSRQYFKEGIESMKRWMRTGLLLAAAVLACCGMIQYRQQRMTAEIAQKVIRFHVRANSDAQEDQNLKLKVRDAIGAYMQPKLSGICDIEDSRRVIQEYLPQIRETAEDVVAQEGYTYDVEASLAVTDFPQKTYGDYTFPAGRYEALEVVIGAGGGHNWWCVMYPNLCFFNSAYEVVDDQAKESLQRALTPEEYESLMEGKDYKIRFALAERVMELFER